MNQKQIQWFPGHMAKTRRMIKESLGEVDIILELLDARIPYSSKNPEIDLMTQGKPKLIVLTKSSLANPAASEKWIEYYRSVGSTAVLIDSTEGSGIKDLESMVRSMLQDKLDAWERKGMNGRKIKAMIVGIPNVGKSSLINRLCGSRRAAVEDRPGVTLNKQWVNTDIGFTLMDMPGVLWPKFEDERVGENLAITGAIKDKILDTEAVAMSLCSRLYAREPSKFLSRYKLTVSECDGLDGYDLFELVAKKRGLLMSGGIVNSERCAGMLLDEFRGGIIGRITLEYPEDILNAKL